MRLTAILLLVGSLTVSAHGKAQDRVTLHLKGVSLETVLDKIQEQTGYTYLYSAKDIPLVKKFDINVKGATVEQVLDQCLKGLPVRYEIENKMIKITRQQEMAVADKTANLDKQESNDVVVEIAAEDGKRLSGATISIKKLGIEGITNEAGEITLKGIPSGKYEIEVTYVGYEKYVAEITINGSHPHILLSLKHTVNNLDEVQVIAYGSTTERLNTGDVTSVNSKEISEQPVSNPMLALEGRVPGLLVTQSTGVPGSGLTVRVQGQNSLSSGNDPLYVIDGVPYEAQMLPNISTQYGILGGNGNTNPNTAVGGGSPLAYLSPSDIESISVLKDADATAIYGSRAANGAILITTKKASPGRTSLNLNSRDGWGTVGHMMPLLNTPEYLAMRHEAKNNSSATVGPTDYDMNGIWDTTRNTNWQKVLIGRTAHYTDNDINVSGGTTSMNYLIGGTYHRETTVFPGDLYDQKGGMHFSINGASSNQRFRVQLTANYLVDDNHIIGQDLTMTALTLAPDAPTIHKADGSLNWAPNASGNSTWKNPLSYLQNAYQIKTNNLIGGLVASYRIVNGLDVKVSAGYNDLTVNDVEVTPLSSFAPELQASTQNFADYGASNSNTWNVEPQLSYKHALANGILEALVGGTALQTNSSMTQTYGFGYSSDQQLYNMSAASSLRAALPSILSTYKYTAVFARVKYDWKTRYLVDLTARRDGSSRFGSANEFHNFASAAGAWIFTNEPGVHKMLPWISFGKLRVSYGTTGNDQIGDYQYLALYSALTSNIQNAYQGASSLAPNGLSNPYIQWELTKKLQGGINLGFWKDRILLAGDYYFNRSSNQLQRYALPEFTGNSGILTNFPALVQNTGWELTLKADIIKSASFSWTTNINLTIPRNKLVSYPGLASSTYANTFVVGKPITIMKVFKYEGINQSTGIYQFGSASGQQSTSTPNYPADLIAVVNLAPQYFGGFENSFQYKGVGLDILLQYVNQVGKNYLPGRFPGRFISTTSGTIVANQPTWVLSRWQSPGKTGLVQEYASVFTAGLSQAYSDASGSTFAYSDASFARLKNVSLWWELPVRWISHLSLASVKVYAQAQNLWTWTHFKGLDPENQSTSALPPLRIITVGASVGL